jgi:hypothetical protein
LPAPAHARFQQIQMLMGGRDGGCWDIIAGAATKSFSSKASSSGLTAYDCPNEHGWRRHYKWTSSVVVRHR